MWMLPIELLLICGLLYLGAATGYLVSLSLAYFLVHEPVVVPGQHLRKFAVLVPAHNEELLIGRLCESLLAVQYPQHLFDIYIVADNCDDNTATVCRRSPVRVLERRDLKRSGKGHAIGWALRRIPLAEFDAVFIIDADSVVDPDVLVALNEALAGDARAVQCFNGVGNRDDSWFTQLLYVARTIGNLLYHQSKEKLGLSSYLMGNGICLSSDLLREQDWTAYSIGEDWEYSARLAERHERVGFAARARVYHQESRSLNQATSQRLRWSSGRFQVVRTLGGRLFWSGLKQRDWRLVDASLALVFPNYSLLVNLTLLLLGALLLLPDSSLRAFEVVVCLVCLTGQVWMFLAGAVIAGKPWKILSAALRAPLFLVWKLGIDLLSVTGLIRPRRWIRTQRHLSKAAER